MITFLLILCAVFMVGGFVAYNPLRRKMDGIIGVGGAYLILLGILMLFASIGQIAGTISGTSNVSALEIILGIAVAVAGLGYMVIVMLSAARPPASASCSPLPPCSSGSGSAGGCSRPSSCTCPWRAGRRAPWTRSRRLTT